MKDVFRKSFLGELLISELHCFESKFLPMFVNDRKAVYSYYKKLTGKRFDEENPVTFCDKLNWYKLNYRNPLMCQCADKVGVREYVQSKGYEECLNEIYGVYDNFSDIDFLNLPDQFVIKMAHGSHMNYIVKDKKKFNKFQSRLMIKSWMHQNIYWGGREWVYKDIPKRIIVEKYLEDETGELKDYKFFCFHGEPTYMQYDIGRYSDKQYRNYYDMNLSLLPFNDGTPNLPSSSMNLSNDEFKQMKKIAADLSLDFPQVRVDFYLVNGKIFFGEMTFFDGGGSTIFVPDEWNVKFSENWKVSTPQII